MDLRWWARGRRVIIPLLLPLILLAAAGLDHTLPERALIWVTSLFSPVDEDPTISPLWHNMTDKLLFQAALRMKRNTSTTVTLNVAFLFLTRGPLPHARLWARFLTGNEGRYTIYIHAHPHHVHHLVDLPTAFRKRRVPSKEAFWGEISIIDAERRLIANALLDPANERFLLVSESCIPVIGFDELYTYLLGSAVSFVDSFDQPGPFGRGRYRHGMFPTVNRDQWRKGSQWVEVAQRDALRLIGDTTFYPVFARVCRKPIYVDEHYFPTFLYITAGASIANRSVTYVDWSRGGYHPAEFGAADVTVELIRKIKGRHSCMWNNESGQPCFLIARKFKPDASAKLLALPKDVLGY
eukprot:SM000026S09005  [mRNA]  locus=s26:897034:898813:- [translate_table: standard]